MPKNTNASLSSVPVRLAVDVDLADGRKGTANHVVWMSRVDADACEMRQLGRIEAACSVLKPCLGPDGGTLRVESDIVTLPFEAAERLETEGSVKILRDDGMIAIHRAAWNDAAEAQKAAIKRSRELMREAYAFAKHAGSSSAWRPQIDWDTPVKASSIA